MTRVVIMALMALMLAVAAPVASMADELDDAKAQGLVGERPDGLLGAVVSPVPGPVQALVNRINGERLEKYRAVASKNGTSVEAVGAVVAEEVRRRAPAGTYFLGAGGWTRK